MKAVLELGLVLILPGAGFAQSNGEPMAQLIVNVQAWSDGTPVVPPAKRPGSGNEGQAPAPREALRATERSLAEAVQRSGFAEAVIGAMGPDAVLLIDGAPILPGEYAAQALRAQQGMAGARVTWMPYRVVTSTDQSIGVTFGVLLLEPKGRNALTGRYIAVWRHDAGSWRLAAYLHNGAWAEQVTLPGSLTRYAELQQSPGDPFAAADRSFAKLAADSGAPHAFARYIAPDGITFAGTGEINIGPANVKARMSEGPAASSSWKWWPVRTVAAASGDLGATIGEAEIRSSAGSVVYSKYLTVWQRQPDGSLKFLVDGGNSRPPGGT